MKKFVAILGIALVMLSLINLNTAVAEDKLKLAMVVKNIGNPFFDAIRKGWDEACAELGVLSDCLQALAAFQGGVLAGVLKEIRVGALRPTSHSPTQLI